MKRLTYLITLLGLLLASCTDEDALGTPLTGNDDKTAFQFSVNMPEYIPALTRAATDENAVNDLWLMTFDTNGLFIGRAHASLLSSNSNGTGTFRQIYPMTQESFTSLPIIPNGIVLTNVPPCRKMKGRLYLH
ncbi:MAG: hypothetical protein ACLUE2_02315 [Bacteroides cellulosilyticus]